MFRYQNELSLMLLPQAFSLAGQSQFLDFIIWAVQGTIPKPRTSHL